MGERDDLLFFQAIVGFHEEFYIDCVGMTDGDAGLEPPELDRPMASKRIWTHFELTQMFLHFTPMLTCADAVRSRAVSCQSYRWENCRPQG